MLKLLGLLWVSQGGGLSGSVSSRVQPLPSICCATDKGLLQAIGEKGHLLEI